MARQRKQAAPPLSGVHPGDVFAMPLEDGRLGVCRVLQVAADGSQALVAASPWVGTQPPDLADPELRVILRKTHHAWRNDPEVGWVSDPVPTTFTHLGTIAPKAAERSRWCGAYCGWQSFPLQVFLQWRWDHERDKVLAEDATEEQARTAAQDTQQRAYKPLPARTLEDLRRQVPFENWTGYVEPVALRGSRRIIRETIDALIALGPDAPEPARLDEVRHAVERFNLLDEELDHFIMSIERDHICDLLRDLAALIGLDDYGEALASARDW